MNEDNGQPIEMERTTDDLKPALWVRLLDEIREGGLSYGKKFDTKWMADKLACEAFSIEFGAGVSQINDEIIGSGYYLSARDQKGETYMLVLPEQFESVADARVRRSFREIKRSIAMFNGLAQNPEAQLTDIAKHRLESKAEKNAVRLALMLRPLTFARQPKVRKMIAG